MGMLEKLFGGGNSLSLRMKREAMALGLCDKWTAEWRDGSTKDELLEKYVRGIDFCIKHDFPGNEVIKMDFGDVIHKHGVFVDESVDGIEDEPIVVLNGRCHGRMRYGGFAVGTVYVRHDCDVEIEVRDMAQVFVEVYDNAVARVLNDSVRRCFMYDKGGRCECVCGDVTVRRKKE